MTTTATAFNVPTKSEVSESNQAIFEQLGKQIGFVPNLYAYYAKMKRPYRTTWHCRAEKPHSKPKRKKW